MDKEIQILAEYDGFTVCIEDARYRFSHDMDEGDYRQLKWAFERATSHTTKVTVEESY